MATTTGIKAGRAWVELGVDSTALERGLRIASNQVRDFGKNAQAIGQTMMKVGVLAGTPFALGAKLFSDYESQMANVKVLSHATAEEFVVMGKRAKQLGLDTIFSAAQAAEAMAVFAQAQFSVNDVLKATGPAMDLAATGHIDVARAAKISTGILKGMRIEVEKLPAVIDVLARAATSSATDLEQLGEAFRFIGPVAQAAGVNLMEITAAVQLLSDANIPGEQSGTALRGMLLSLLSPTSEAADMLAAMGIQLRDSRHDFVGLASVLGQFQSRLAGLGKVDRLEAIGRVFPDRQTAAASVLIANGALALMKKTADLGSAAGTAAGVAAVKMDTLRGATERLMSSLEGIGIALGEAITPALRRWGDILVDVANSVARLTDNNKEFVVWLGKMAVATVGLGAAFTGVGLAARLVAFQIGTLRLGAGAAVFGFNALKKTLPLVKVSWKALVAAFSAGLTVFKAVSVFWWQIVNSVAAVVYVMRTAGASIVGLTFSLSALAPLVSAPVLITAAVIAMGVAIYKLGLVGKTLTWLGEQFTVMAKDAKVALGGVADALRAGNVELAMRIFWAGLDVIWKDGMLAITELAAGWGDDLANAWSIASSNLASIWIATWHGMAIGSKEIMADVKDASADLFDWIRKGVADTGGALAENRASATAERKKMAVNIKQRADIADVRAAGGDPAQRAEKIAAINRKADQDRMEIEKERAEVFQKGAKDEAAAAKKAAAAAAQRDKERMAARIKSVETYTREEKAVQDMLKKGMDARFKASNDAIAKSKEDLKIARQKLDVLNEQARVGLLPKPVAEPEKKKEMSREERAERIRQARRGLLEARRAAVGAGTEEERDAARKRARELKDELAGLMGAGAQRIEKAKELQRKLMEARRAAVQAATPEERAAARKQAQEVSDEIAKQQGKGAERAAKVAGLRRKLLEARRQAGGAGTEEERDVARERARALKMAMAEAEGPGAQQVDKIKRTQRELLEARRQAVAGTTDEERTDAKKRAKELSLDLAKQKGELTEMREAAGLGGAGVGGMGGGDRLESLLGGGGGRLSLEGLGLGSGKFDRTLKEAGTSAQGTFDASSLMGMGIGEEWGEKQLKESKKQTELLGSIDKQLGQGEAKFA